jgi:hypothetical protein
MLQKHLSRIMVVTALKFRDGASQMIPNINAGKSTSDNKMFIEKPRPMSP